MIQWKKLYGSVDDDLPIADDLEDENNPYYLIYTRYGASLAMYMVNDEGECNWYKDYNSIVVGKVIGWTSINKP